MNLQCPYCLKQFNSNHNDGLNYEQEILHQIECPHCFKIFVYQTSITFHFAPQKAECLNDGQHNYQLTNTHPKELSKMKCSFCAYERELSQAEKNQFNIGPIERYIKNLIKLQNPTTK